MRSFHFRLQRVLRLRETEAKSEEAKLEQARQVLHGYESALQALLRSADSSQRCAKEAKFVQSFALAALDRYEGQVKREQEQWRSRIAAQESAIAGQRQLVVAARRKVELLKKLRDAQAAEWQAEANRELEQTIADFSAAEWSRRAREH